MYLLETKSFLSIGYNWPIKDEKNGQIAIQFLRNNLSKNNNGKSGKNHSNGSTTIKKGVKNYSERVVDKNIAKKDWTKEEIAMNPDR